MITEDRRIRIIAGHYGSGKTEFAINYAFKLKKIKRKVAIADLDIINVYFRSREKRKELEEANIELVSSSIIQNNCDIPSISARAVSILHDSSINYIIDIGGNDIGMRVLAGLRPYLSAQNSDFFMVVNTNRPETSNVDGILNHKKALEESIGMFITGFILNTNLIHETTLKNIIEGNKILQKASKIVNVPIRYTSYIQKEIELNQDDVIGKLFPMNYYMRKEWY